MNERLDAALRAWLDSHGEAEIEEELAEAATEYLEAAPEKREIDGARIGDLTETILLELGLHNCLSTGRCDCGDHVDGDRRTFNEHVAAMIDYRLTATDGDA